jgi:DNA-binding YbaB/EbfC family protein
MGRRGGFPGGGMPGNMNNLMKQAQRMQRQMAEKQEELESKEYTASAGGGAVEVTVSGKKELTNVKISPDACDPEDVEMLQDMIMAAVNEAMKQADDASAAAMGSLTGGLGGLM